MANDFNRPWTMQEMIDNSENWNLAGDVGILQSLKSFANTVITRSTEINNKLNHLNNNLSETKLRLNLAQNKLHCLRNSQFIESRVYDDDETLPLKEHSKNEDLSEKSPADSIEFTKRFGKLTLNTINNFFDKVEVTVSDTEDEDDNLPNYIFRRKDLYLDRPLPYIIGSEEWYKKWHVGLEDSSSDSESEKLSDEKFSETSSDAEFDDLPQNYSKANLSEVKSNSDTSSELDFQNNRNIKQNRDVISSGDDTNSVQSFKNKNFAEQLAEKLGNVINEVSLDSEVNTRPIQAPEPSRYGNLFFDEPPPLDDDIVKKPSGSGLFSSGPGLFDDDDELEDNKIETPKPILKKQQRDLFNEESSDDDLFSSLKNPIKSQLFNEINNSSLINEEPPELDKKKKPIGGVSVFGNVKIGANKLMRRYSSSEDEEEKSSGTTPSVKEENQSEKVQKNVIEEAVKKISLFDNDEEEKIPENKPIIPQKNNNKTTKGLFDDDDDDEDIFKSDLFSSSNKKFTSALFDDEEEDSKIVKAPQNKLSKDLFEESDEFMIDSLKTGEIPNEKVEDKAQATTQSSEDLFENVSRQKTQLKLSLFDSPPPIDSFFDTFGGDSDENYHFNNDDLFAPETKVKSSTPEVVKSDNSKPFNFMQNASLFDPTPPQDEWDPKSEEVDDQNDFLSDEEISTSRRGSFYDIFAATKEPEIEIENEEKPSVKNATKPFSTKKSLFSDDENDSDNLLFTPRKEPEEKTQTKSEPKVLPSKIKHNLNINVAALMPGVGPPKQVSQIKKEPSVDNMGSYFDTVDNVQVLHSLTKDRVRGVGSRRPSSKKGRRAALQRSESNSDIEYVEQIQTSKDVEVIPPVKDKVEKTVVNINKKTQEKSKKVSLFDEDDSDGDLFSKTTKSNTDNTNNSFAKRSLFEDEDSDDDDFFKTASTDNKSRDVSTAVTKKIQKNNFKKIKPDQPAEDDPLSALLK